MPPGINIIHDIPVFCSNAVVFLLVTAAKIFIDRAELQVKRGLERRPVIQALRVPQQTAHQAWQGEAKKGTWAKKENPRAAAAPSSARPNSHFLQRRFPEVRCIEIPNYFIVRFIHPLCFTNCQPTELSICSGLLTFSLSFSLWSLLLGRRETLQAASPVFHMSHSWTLPLDIPHPYVLV